MTSIFLPITLTAFALIVSDVQKTEIPILVFSWIVVFSLLTYWFRSSQYLDSWNETRRERLQLLENYFNKLDYAHLLNNNEDFFKQYNLEYKGGFKRLTLCLYLVLIIATFGILIVKLSL
jgi:hypothetical protein